MAGQGRPRKPTARLEVVGAFDKNPQRKRTQEPKPKLGLGLPPKSLNKEERKLWNELIKNAADGVLTVSDRWSAEIMVKLMWEFRSGYENFPVMKMSRLASLLGHFGFTPSERSKVEINLKNESSDPWGDL